MNLAEVVRGCVVIETRGDTNVEIENVAGDSRRCGPGSLFVAIPGFERDGAEFITHALERGASAIATERSLEKSSGATFLRIGDARGALAIAASNLLGRPSEQLSLIGVTGTSGKTTTTRMIESILDATGAPVGLVGTIEYRAGRIREIADRTTPDAVMLQEWLRKMVEENVPRGVMEVSSHALALKRTLGVKFRVAVFTNLSRDHFDFHDDFEDYFRAKKLLFDQIDRSSTSAVVNVDDEYGRRLANELGEIAVGFGRGAGSAIHPVEGFEVSLHGLHGELLTPSGRVRIDSPLVGWPNLDNWMGAVGAAQLAGIEDRVIEEGVRMLQGVRGRFERVPVNDRYDVFVDYAHKPDALEKLLFAVRDLVGQRRIVLVFGCGGDRDRGKRPLMGEIAGRLADFSIITSDNPRGEDPVRIVAEIEAGIVGVEGAEFTSIVDRRQAIRTAIRSADDGDVIIVAGKGHETYQTVGDRIIHFDDREEVENALDRVEQSA